MNHKKTIVISGINMVEGGIFTILDNCLQKISLFNAANDYTIKALVHSKDKFSYPNIEYFEYPDSKKSWLKRLYYEFYYFKKLSKKWNPDIWLSLHDTTPTVVSKKQFMYFHHPTIFYNATWYDWKFDYKIGIFSKLYYYLSKKNIYKNNAVFVQQFWIKEKFKALYPNSKVIVAKPEFTEILTNNTIALDETKIHFFYPSFPRTFKNFELLFDAIKLLDPSVASKTMFHFSTIAENPNKFAKYLFKKYHNFNNVTFYGWLSREQLLTLYNSVDCIVFPSKLETWGLPISEAKAFKKPLLVANLPYTKETVGDYQEVSFFDVDNAKELAALITQFTKKSIQYQGNKYPYTNEFALENWNELFNFILQND